uniref:Putative methyltransferase n=3 Tax=viral metagenome TaxID=1070528 RepID=A0A6M3KA52_9ZZZZ
MKLPIKQIQIPQQRDRTDVDEKKTDALAESLRLIGQIQPIVVDNDLTLICGWRRVQAAKMLGWADIEAVQREDVDEWQRKVMEFEENYQREDLSYEDEVNAVANLHELYQQKHGKALDGVGGAHKKGWNVAMTAQLLGSAVGKVSQDMQLARAIKQNPALGKFKTKAQAVGALKRQQELVARTLMASLGGTSIAPSAGPVRFPFRQHGLCQLVHADCIERIETIPDSSVHCLLTDPPWQVQFDAQFGSDPDTGLQLTKQMLLAVHPKLVDGALGFLFCATKHLMKGTIYQLLLGTGYHVKEQIMLWYKPKVAHSMQPYREVKNDYEPIMVFSKGISRDFLKPVYAVQEFLLPGRKIHDAQKPVELLKVLVHTATVENELVIDPFCGSAQTGVACNELGRRSLCIEKDEQWFFVASTELTGGTK